jgi:hypothetical protein
MGRVGAERGGFAGTGEFCTPLVLSHGLIENVILTLYDGRRIKM